MGLSERLQVYADLTLEKAKKAVRQKKAVKEQYRQLQAGGTKQNPIVVDKLKGCTPPHRPPLARREEPVALGLQRAGEAKARVPCNQHASAVVRINTR